MTRIGIAVKELDGVLVSRRVHKSVIDTLANEHGAHGHCGIGDALGSGEQIRLHAEILAGKAIAKTTEPGDHLIENQQDTVLGANLAQPLQIALGRN